eukprot:2675220-Rhodomonas_salina.1
MDPVRRIQHRGFSADQTRASWVHISATGPHFGDSLPSSSTTTSTTSDILGFGLRLAASRCV